MASPFAIQQRAPMQGLQMLAGAMQDRQDFERKRVAENKNLQLRKQVNDVMVNGTPEEVAEFVTLNPGAKAIADETIKFKSEATKRNLVEGAKKRLMGEVDPVQSLTDHADLVIKEGGDATQSIGAVQAAMQDPNANEEADLKILAMYDKPAFENLMKLRGETLKDTRTKDIKEFEYGEKNPKFLMRQKEKEDKERTKAVSAKGFKNSMDLRKEFTSQSADFQKVRDAYTRVSGSTEDPSPAGDLSLIFNYMKMLDPGSVVRESEFATAAAAGSYGERIKASVGRVISGERLSPKMRNDFLEKSGVLMKGIESQHKKREKSYRNIAEKNGLDPNEVVIDLTVPQEDSQGRSLQDFMVKAKKVNPNATEQEITAYYNKKYGGQ